MNDWRTIRISLNADAEESEAIFDEIVDRLVEHCGCANPEGECRFDWTAGAGPDPELNEV